MIYVCITLKNFKRNTIFLPLGHGGGGYLLWESGCFVGFVLVFCLFVLFLKLKRIFFAEPDLHDCLCTALRLLATP